jgi:hypothetical protein
MEEGTSKGTYINMTDSAKIYKNLEKKKQGNIKTKTKGK